MMPTSHDKSIIRRSTARRGLAVYLFVVVVATLLGMTGLTLVAIERSNRRVHTSLHQSLQAQYVAHAAIERALAYMDADANWRQNMPNGEWSTRGFGSGSYVLEVTDPDGSLTNNDNDLVTLTSTGTVGEAVYKVQVTAAPQPYEALKFACFAVDDIEFKSNCVIRGPVRAHDNIWTDDDTDPEDNAYFETLQGGYVEPPLEPTRYTSSALPYPQPSLSYYLALATPIVGDDDELYNYVLTPTRNSESPAQINPNGIYALNANANDIQIENTRIKGTLIIYNLYGKKVTIKKACWIEPAGPNYPTLLLFNDGGDLKIEMDEADLSESSENVDFNEDGDTADTFPGLIRGVVWTEGSYIEVHKPYAHVIGCLIGWDIKVHDRATVDEDPALAQQLMPGFVDPDMKIVAGSWKEIQP